MLRSPSGGGLTAEVNTLALMPLIVQKYGGTSVADPDRIKRVSRRAAETRRAGNDLIVVVSAMGSSTDDLIALANLVSSDPPAREMDMLLTAGERISMALLAMALHDQGVPALSLTGSQAGILTDAVHGQAKITEIRGGRVRKALAGGSTVIVAGFQGLDPDSREVTTLGRGGSDTPRWPWPLLIVRPPARSTPMWKGCTPPTPERSPKPASWKKFRSTRCWRWRLRGPGF